MKTEPKGVLSGTHKLSGNQACAEGAIAAGCRFLSAYPIPPSIEVIERFTKRAKDIDAVFIQMEDEISVLSAVLGASWAGKKAMTVTSGPGFSLMMEHLGLGVMLETPCVIVDVQRCGPSEGIPNSPGQGDVMQARWGSHGDYEVIALSPNSPQEMFELMIKSFNYSEKYRTPVVLLADQSVGSMVEEVVIPPANKIKIERRKLYKGPKDKYLPFQYDKDLVPPMVITGDGYKFHVTGLTHDEKGYPVMNEECQELNVHRLVRKIRNYTDKIVETEEKNISDAEIVVISYGITSRTAEKAIKQARKDGIKVGSLRLITIWPFPDNIVRKLSRKVKAIIVAELNYGQILLEVQRCNYGNAKLQFAEYGNEEIQDQEPILNAIRSLSK
ncbi:2-oxoacid:acceptor oxidoreductase subunit alpha [candidate division WOR-3 bacterium]|nr:2-oxoacid:acceptor oxidoreductase subunit alpha [candidate division WOR-3 bacterium]